MTLQDAIEIIRSDLREAEKKLHDLANQPGSDFAFAVMAGNGRVWALKEVLQKICADPTS